jgi:hypothetical protein
MPARAWEWVRWVFFNAGMRGLLLVSEPLKRGFVAATREGSALLALVSLSAKNDGLRASDVGLDPTSRVSCG